MSPDSRAGRFDAATVADAAAAVHDVDADSLADALTAHQRIARPSRSVDDVVYEYRRAYSPDPLVARTDGWYVLAVPDHVWPEFEAALEADPDLFAALRDVHRAVYESVVGDVPDAGDPLVFARDA